MDKITRMLLLYSKLIKGERIIKAVFCFETNCSYRSFDRDVEDIRLFLSDSFEANELIYNRMENAYYINGVHRTELEATEYLFVESILRDTAVLRKDEFEILTTHLLSNTENAKRLQEHSKSIQADYQSPEHNKALLKMHSDLISTIKNKAVIKIQYMKQDGTEVQLAVIPCLIKYDLGYVYLIAFRDKMNDPYPTYYRIDRIHSFGLVRSQLSDDRVRVEEYLEKYAQGITQMYGGKYKKITVKCKPEFYSYIHDKFKKIIILNEEERNITICIEVFEDGFIKWILSQPQEQVIVIEPESTKKKITEEAKKIIKRYTEEYEDVKEN